MVSSQCTILLFFILTTIFVKINTDKCKLNKILHIKLFILQLNINFIYYSKILILFLGQGTFLIITLTTVACVNGISLKLKYY